MEKQKEKLQYVKGVFLGVAIALLIQLIMNFAVPTQQFTICRDENCDNFCYENSQILVKESGEDVGIIYVYIFEKITE